MFHVSVLIKKNIIVRKYNLYYIIYLTKFFFFYSYYSFKNFALFNLILLIKIFRFFFFHFSYTGKTYKIINQKKFLNFSMNKAHINYLFFNSSIILRRFTKSKYLFILFFAVLLKTFKLKFKQIRWLNIFTHRGLKILNTIIFKKKGKISTYTI